MTYEARPGRQLRLLAVKIRDVLCHGLLLQTGLGVLGRVGIEITPYYIVAEAAAGQLARLTPTTVPELQMRFLEPDDVSAVGAMPEGGMSEAEAHELLESGVMGFGAWSGGELVSVMWAHLEELDFDPCRRPLEADEAYLFDAKTSRAYRGMNLAPNMRIELYRTLAELGRRRLSSVSYALNRPAIRFKQKLNAHFTRQYVYINLWGLWRHNCLMRQDPKV